MKSVVFQKSMLRSMHGHTTTAMRPLLGYARLLLAYGGCRGCVNYIDLTLKLKENNIGSNM